MKHYILVFMAFWNILFGNATEPVDWANKARYELENRELMSQCPDSNRIVMMGNSITEYWVEQHPGFFTTHHLVGRGISGQVSSQMLARFRQDVINLEPRIVIINCGTNDIAENNGPYNEDITMDNIQSMTELALAHGIEVVLTSVLPCDRFCWNTNVHDVVGKISRLNERIRGYASTVNPRVHYLNYYPAMTLDGKSMNHSFTDDGVHPNSRGYDAMEVKLMELLTQLNAR